MISDKTIQAAFFLGGGGVDFGPSPFSQILDPPLSFIVQLFYFILCTHCFGFFSVITVHYRFTY